MHCGTARTDRTGLPVMSGAKLTTFEHVTIVENQNVMLFVLVHGMNMTGAPVMLHE